MKKLIAYLLLASVSFICNAEDNFLDSKYIKIGVVSSGSEETFQADPNIRYLGNLGDINYNNFVKSEANIWDKKAIFDTQLAESVLNQMQWGKKVLDMLLLRDDKGLHMDMLYSQALSNTTLEETEIARLDMSASDLDVLKKDISKQLLKNNYIIFTSKPDEHGKLNWYVFKVEIDDKIIDQAFLNWTNPSLYDQITVPIKYVAKGKAKENNLIIKIANKVPDFAVRGPIFQHNPVLVRTTFNQGVRKLDRFGYYRMYQRKDGSLISKRIGTGRVTEVNNDYTRLLTIAGRFANERNGDIGVLLDRNRSALSLMGQASFGKDYRYGGRLQYELLMSLSKAGFSQYFLGAIEYNQFKKEPYGVWFDENENCIQPTLRQSAAMIGYGAGYMFGGRFEIRPYVLFGYQISFFDNKKNIKNLNLHSEEWESTNLDQDSSFDNGVVGYIGANFICNIWYPMQLIVGADYNYSKIFRDSDMYKQHTLNRVNTYVGLRLNF